MTIDGYVDVAEEESSLFCAVLNQPISVGIDGGAWDFQLYTSVSIISASFIIHIFMKCGLSEFSSVVTFIYLYLIKRIEGTNYNHNHNQIPISISCFNLEHITSIRRRDTIKSSPNNVPQKMGTVVSSETER